MNDLLKLADAGHLLNSFFNCSREQAPFRVLPGEAADGNRSFDCGPEQSNLGLLPNLAIGSRSCLKLLRRCAPGGERWRPAPRAVDPFRLDNRLTTGAPLRTVPEVLRPALSRAHATWHTGRAFPRFAAAGASGFGSTFHGSGSARRLRPGAHRSEERRDLEE